ncbi:regulating synaptic membrane exocytosis 1 isoform X1 [Olea europaea subsp. europaea]|uniref:Regulating synaptic membrane exocytosis 1 isoform X1 n=1 Tax=Olea europaea subsp. europaea TaxID=158383 RepID=A0A8S0TGA7_OLEEU|nr:regulating synaptic membrane exocytosis 1 isoform X1 [Olea europaea subsp. europaea]
MTKGQFEVDVVCAQGLRMDHETATGIYVKLHLRGRSRGNKRKTRIVQPCESPSFKQTVRYDASLVDNKLLEVSVWLKQGSYRGKQAIGSTDVRLSSLDLAQPQFSWYSLRSMDNVSSSSVDE